MKKKYNLFSILMLCMMMVLSSCSKEVLDELTEEEETETTGNSQLEIVTRTGENDEVVSYPVLVYVFNSSDKCINVQTISSASESMSVNNVKAGTYTVVAIGGADDDVYDLPTQDDAAPDDVIVLKENQNYNDLMLARSTVTMAEGETNKATLTMERKVFMLQGVIIRQVPESVKGVSVTVSPLRENVSMSGEYSGNEGSYTVTLTKQSDNTTWKNTATLYLLPSVGNVSIKVSMTRSDDSVTSFTYTANEAMTVNYKMSIDGTYAGDDFVMQGVLTGASWAGERTITFNFDSNGSSGSGGDSGGGNNNEDPNPSGDPTVVTGTAPALGADYNGALVVYRSEPANDGSVMVKLLAPRRASIKVESTDDQTAIKTKVDAGLATIAVSGLEGWRIPTKDEIDDLIANLTDVNSWLSGYTNYDIMVAATWYYIQHDANTIMTYKQSSNQVVTPSGTNSVRAITTYTFKPAN